MADNHVERFRQHEAILAGLARMLEAQHAMTERVEGFMQRLLQSNRNPHINPTATRSQVSHV